MFRLLVTLTGVDDEPRRDLTPFLTTNLDFSKWPEVFRSEQLTGALLDRLTHHAQILTMNAESYRFKQSMSGKKKQ